MRNGKKHSSSRPYYRVHGWEKYSRGPYTHVFVKTDYTFLMMLWKENDSVKKEIGCHTLVKCDLCLALSHPDDPIFPWKELQKVVQVILTFPIKNTLIMSLRY